MKQHVTVHERPKPAPRGVTMQGDRLGMIVGGDNDERGNRDELGRVKVRTILLGGNSTTNLDRIDFISPEVLRDFAHGILRVIGDEG